MSLQEECIRMLGIDVSKETLSATLLDPTTRQVQWERTVANTTVGVGELLRRAPREAPWVLEPTGRYSTGVAKQAHAAARTVLLAPPKKAKAFLRAVQDRAKTDRLDSRGLALYGCATTLAPYPLKSEDMEQLDQLLAARKGLAQALMRLAQQEAELPHAAEALAPAIRALRAQRDELDRRIAALIADTKRFPMVAELDRVPGIGPVIAAAAASRLQAKAFAHPDAFVAYIGLDVQAVQSGKRKGQRGLTKQGDAELRRLLYLAAQANLRCKESPFKAHYQRERDRGRTSTAALCIVARKLARVCWSIVHHRTTYDPKRVYEQPKGSKSGPSNE